MSNAIIFDQNEKTVIHLTGVARPTLQSIFTFYYRHMIVKIFSYLQTSVFR